jgi:hypothetical protein
MNEKFLILERSVCTDLAVIDHLYESLGTPELAAPELPPGTLNSILKQAGFK